MNEPKLPIDPATQVARLWKASELERHVSDLVAAGALLTHSATSPNQIGEDELLHLARVVVPAAAAVRDALARTDALLEPVRRAEQARAAGGPAAVVELRP